MVEYPGFKRNEKRSNQADVTLGPAMTKEIGGESIGEGECSDGKFEEARRSVNSGAEFSFWESPEMAYAEVRAMPRGAPQGVLRDRLVGVGA